MSFQSKSVRTARPSLALPTVACAMMALALIGLGATSKGFGQTSPGPSPVPASPGTISGTVMDQSGAVVAGAHVRLTCEDEAAPSQAAIAGTDGQFFFPKVAPGAFELSVTSAGFATQTFSGTLHADEVQTVPVIVLTVAENVTQVQVAFTQAEVAEEQLKGEEHQRILGAIPNFYVSYLHDTVPLTSKQKFKLAWKSVTDPISALMVAGGAGVEQAQNHFQGYGQGAQGYGKRFGAGYADMVSGTFIGGAILPSLLKQDPRYFYKGTGSKPARFFYAIANAFICKGDNGRWQPNYSNVVGNLAAGGISNIYYPAADRDGLGLTFENAGIGLGANAATNLIQEFIIKKLTPKVPKTDPVQTDTVKTNSAKPDSAKP